jgi:DNA modification methylase
MNTAKMNIMKVKLVPIEDLKMADYNPRGLNEVEFQELKESLRTFGFVEPLVVNSAKKRKNVIIGGHQRFRVAKEIGMEQVPVHYLNIADLEKEKELNLRLNKNTGHWDWDLLKNFDKDMLLDIGFDQIDINKNFGVEEIEEDNVPGISKEARAKRGDIYYLGKHRLMCGDATKIDDVEKLMDGNKADMVFTDPPYNTGMEGKDGSTRLSHMFKDSFSEEDWAKFLDDVFASYYAFTKEEAAFYVCIDWRRVSDIKGALGKIMKVSNVIVWDKVVHGLGSDYKYTYEMIVVAKKGNPEINNRFGDDYRDIWHLQRNVGRNEDHATAKPLGLCSKPIKHASKMGDICLDLFLGSGSTLVACEQLNRVCYGMEIDPSYCDVIIERYCNYTSSDKKNIYENAVQMV